MKSLYFLAGAILAATIVTPAVPATLNIPVAARVISFIQPIPVGIVPVAIIYQPGNVSSEAEATDMERAFSSGMKLGRANLRVRKVSVTSLGQLGGARAAFVTAGLRPFQDEVSAVSASQSILTITADTNCVEQGRCIIGISSGGRTQITVNKAAAKRSGVRFGSAFLMLVKEI